MMKLDGRWAGALLAASSLTAACAAQAQLYRQSDVLSRSVRTPVAAAMGTLTKATDEAEKGWVLSGFADAVVDVGNQDDRALVVPFALAWGRTVSATTWELSLDSDGYVAAWSPDSTAAMSDLRLSARASWAIANIGDVSPAVTLTLPSGSVVGSQDAALGVGFAFRRSLGQAVAGATYEYTRVDAGADEAGSRRQSASLSVAFGEPGPTPLLLIVGRDLARGLPASSRAYVQQTLPWKPLPGTTSYVFYRWSRAAGERAHGIGGGLSYAF